MTQTEDEHLFEYDTLENQVFSLCIGSDLERTVNESVLGPIHIADSYLLYNRHS